jgi:protein arginine kinase
MVSPMALDDFIRTGNSLLEDSPLARIAISSRIRFARNLHGAPFPGWADGPREQALYDRVVAAIHECDGFDDALMLPMAELSSNEREILRERWIISSELLTKEAGCGVVVLEDEQMAVMVNEEDHLRLQCTRSGLRLRDAYDHLLVLDQQLEQRLHFAFSPRFGYLTACPSNVGTGLRASVMLHLPGLRLMGEVDPTVRALSRLGFAVRGVFGEGTDAYGSLYQVSNQGTLGPTEEEILDDLQDVVAEVVVQEGQARDRLLQQRRLHVVDHCARAVGIINYARLLGSEETMDLLSGLRLGVECGTVSGVSVDELNRTMLACQPGHLQWSHGSKLPPQERDLLRARVVREALKDISVEG